MKITKLMLSALAAAAVLVSCNKEDLDPSVKGTGMKSVQISLENIVMTKGDAVKKISDGQAVDVSNFKVFLTDASFSQEYAAYDVTGQNRATMYWTAADFAAGPIDATFHYVDSKCNRVVAVANVGDISLQDLTSLEKPIAEQQNPTTLVLVADKALTRAQDDPSTPDVDESVHTSDDGKYNELWEAALTLTPAISRFELDGFSVAFSETPKFDKIQVTDVAFDHYWPTMILDEHNGVFGAIPTGEHVKAVAEPTDDNEVYTWFNTIATLDRWYKDSFTDLVMTPDDPSTTAVYENRADAASPRAYHFYSGTIVPTMYVKLLADDDPAYVWTSIYRKADGSVVSHIEPGKIYRMSGAGEVEGDGSVIIPDDLDPIQKCIDVTVDVIDWAVVLITPDFSGGSTQQLSE